MPERGAVRLQVSVGESGTRSSFDRDLFTLRRCAQWWGGVWTLHAEGVLAPSEVAHSQQLEEWPPAGAIPVEIGGLYEDLAELGLEYGPAFQGLGGVWRRGEDVFAEVSLPVERGSEEHGFLVHPAVLDAALHALGAEAIGDGEGRRGCRSLGVG